MLIFAQTSLAFLSREDRFFDGSRVRQKVTLD